MKLQKQMRNERGIILIATLYMMLALLAMFGAYELTTRMEINTDKYSGQSTGGFYAAEAGLNIRAEAIRSTFVGYNLPTGTSPSTTNACVGSNLGTGDFACSNYSFGHHSVKAYITEEPGNPLITTIPPGELYQNLNAQEYRYTANSSGLDSQGKTEAILELKFKSRLVPLFQFAAFYNKDLEILPGPTMTLNGPVHTNGDLYLNSDNTLSVYGQVTTAGSLFRGRKDNTTCLGTVRVRDPGTYRNLQSPCTVRTLMTQSQLTPWNGMIRTGVDPLTLPDPASTDPTPGQIYWDDADLRLALKIDASGNAITTNSVTGVEVRNQDNSVDTNRTTWLHDTSKCNGLISGKVIGYTGSGAQTPGSCMYNRRENKYIRMLEVDMRGLFDCIHRQHLVGKDILKTGTSLDDTSEGGLVLYLTVDGPNSGVVNNYGFRVRNASNLSSTVAGAPAIKGMTIVSDQAAYLWGDFNSAGTWKGSAVMADSVNLLSNGWSDGSKLNSGSTAPAVAANMTVNTAFLSGTDTTGGIEGVGGQNGAYNGGLENYPRFHENWSGRTLTYRGSFVSLQRPKKVNGVWVYGGQYYQAPNRAWDYDTRFNNAANLPPLSPRFVYLRQELFVRDFEQ